MNLLSAPLAEIQITDYRLRDKGAAFAVLKAINAAPDAPSLPDPLPIAPPVPVSYLGTFKDRIDTHASLSPQEQNQLFLELEEAIDEGRSPAEVRDLLLCLRRRDDSLAKVGTKIDAALKNLDQKISGKSPRKPAPPPPVRISAMPETYRAGFAVLLELWGVARWSFNGAIRKCWFRFPDRRVVATPVHRTMSSSCSRTCEVGSIRRPSTRNK